MSRIATARGYAKSRIYEPGDTVPDYVAPAKWWTEVDGRSKKPVEPEAESPADNLETRTAKALREIAKAEKVAVETDDNKADLVRKIRAARPKE